MQALALALILALSVFADGAAEPHEPAIAGPEAPPAAAAAVDPCAVAREIAAQRPCLAAGDCPSLEMWRRAFGPPGLRLLDPERVPPALAAGRRAARRAPGPPPGQDPPLDPGVVCPVGPGR